jgi:hypothetical protein
LAWEDKNELRNDTGKAYGIWTPLQPYKRYCKGRILKIVTKFGHILVNSKKNGSRHLMLWSRENRNMTGFLWKETETG